MIPITGGHAKELLDLGEKKVIDHAMDESIEAGLTNIFIGINKDKSALKEHLEKKYSEKCDLRFIDIEPNGFCDAIWRAKSIIDNDWFAIILPDMIHSPATSNPAGISLLIDSWSESAKPTIGLYNETQKAFGSGDVINATPKSDGEHEVSFTAPHKDQSSQFKVFGRYILPPGSCSFAAPNQNRETPMLDAIQKESCMIGVMMQGSIFDTGSPEGYQDARKFFE